MFLKFLLNLVANGGVVTGDETLNLNIVVFLKKKEIESTKRYLTERKRERKRERER